MEDIAQELTILPIEDFENRRLILGQIVMMMMDSEVYLKDPLWIVKKNLIGPFLNNQAIVMFNDNQVVGYAAWAWLSDEAEKKYIDYSNSLEPSDWKSGENLWLVDVLAPENGAIEIINYTRSFVAAQGHKGKVVKFKRYYDNDNFKIQEVVL
jgi:hemolysin-activating ACP:hemolysin acyltransferase